ncbi:MAG: hypothetical protein M3439_08985 [Chloroflexota bacterium]|nr:hypothetical protein [Chloroflexota bacterium]
MNVSTTDTPLVPRWRRIAFAIVVVIAALFYLVLVGSVFSVPSPWLAEGGGGPPPGYVYPESHRWHDAQWAAHTGILLGGSLLALFWRPMRKPLLVQYLTIAIVVFVTVTVVTDGPDNLIFLVPVALVVALYPNRRALLDASRPGGMYIPILTLAVIAALLMAPDAWDKFQIQADNPAGDEHAEHGHWGGSAFLMLNLLVAGVLTATRRPGWRVLGVIAGLAFVYLGVATLTTRDDGGRDPAGLWSTAGAALALLAGVGYLGMTLMADQLVARAPRLVGSPRTAE